MIPEYLSTSENDVAAIEMTLWREWAAQVAAPRPLAQWFENCFDQLAKLLSYRFAFVLEFSRAAPHITILAMRDAPPTWRADLETFKAPSDWIATLDSPESGAQIERVLERLAEFVQRFRYGAPVFAPLVSDGYALGVLTLVGALSPEMREQWQAQRARAQNILTQMGALLGAELRRARLQETFTRVARRYDAFVENGLDAFWETDAALNLVYVNQAALDWIGLDESSIIGQNLRQPLPNLPLLPPRDSALHNSFLEQLLTEEQVTVFLLPVMSGDRVMTLSVSARVRRDARGNFLGVQGSARNVTKYVTAQRELEQRTRELEILYELATRLSKSSNARVALHEALELIARLIEADALALGLLDQDAHKFNLVAHRGIESELLEYLTDLTYSSVVASSDAASARGANIIESLIAAQRVLTTADIDAKPPHNLHVARTFGYQSFMAIPLLFGSQILGAALLGSRQPAYFETRAERLAGNISMQLGLALHHYRLLEQHARSERYAKALAQIGSRIQYAPRAEKALPAVARDIKATLQVDYVVIQLLRENYFEAVTATDTREIFRQLPISVYERRVFESDSPLVVADCELAEVDAQQREILRRLNLRASIAMRLFAHEHELGILFVNQAQAYAWHPDQIEFVRRAAQLIAHALENKYLLDESIKQLRIQRALENAARIIGAVLEPEDALHSVAEELVAVFRVDYASFYLLEREMLVLVAESSKTGAPRETPIMPHQQRILRELDTLIVRDRLNENLPAAQREILARYDFSADIGAPMVIGSQAIGLLYLSQRTPRAWTDDEIRLAETFAQQIAVALENARLFRQSQEQVHALRALARSAHLIATGRSLPDALPFIAVELKQVLSADYTGFHLLEGDNLRVITESNHPRNGDCYALLPYHRLVLEHRQRIVVNDRDAEGRDPNHRAILKLYGLRADIGVALVSRNKPLGILYVGQKIPRVWRDSEIQLLETFAQQIASMVDLTLTLNEREARVRELELLTELQELATMNLAEGALEELALHALRGLLDGDTIGLSLLEGNALKPMRVLNGKSYGRAARLGPLIQRIFDVKTPLVLDQHTSAEISAEGQVRLDFYGARAMLAAPMLIASGPVGLLNILFEREHVFSDAEKRLAQAAANQLAMAFANAQLLAQQRQQLALSAKLTEFALFCNSVQDSMTLKSEATRRICDMLGIQAASVRLIHDGALTSGASFGYRNLTARAHSIPIDARLQRILQERQPVELPDLAQAYNVSAHWRERHLAEGFQAGLIMPMAVANQAIGVLTLFHSELHFWTRLEIHHTQTIANILALALANLDEKERVSQATQELQATVDSAFSGILTTDVNGVIRSWNRAAEKITGYSAAVMLGKRWDVDGPRVGAARRDDTLILEAMTDRQACFGLATRYFTCADGRDITMRAVATPLQDSAQTVRGAVCAFWDRTREQEPEWRKLDFINEIAHQLNTKLSAMVISTQRLLQGDMEDKTRQQYTHVLADTLQDLQDFQVRFTAIELERIRESSQEQSVNLREVVDDKVAVMRVRQPRHRFRVRGEFDAVLADPERLRIVLDNVLDNAFKYSPPQSWISIVAECPTAEILTLKINNKGAPIPEHVKPHLFERGQRGTTQTPGRGLGLWLARVKLREMGGDITFVSAAKRGTTFYVTLRRQPKSLPPLPK